LLITGASKSAYHNGSCAKYSQAAAKSHANVFQRNLLNNVDLKNQVKTQITSKKKYLIFFIYYLLSHLHSLRFLSASTQFATSP
jgi:hypothetical protein